MTTPGHPKSNVPSALAKIALGLGVLFLALLISGVVAGAAAIRSFRTSTEFGALHRELVEHLDVTRNSDVEVTVPAWVVALGRVGASFTDVDPEVTTALGALHSGQVGVYELAETPARDAQLGLLKRADAWLLGNGKWSRIITVLDEGQLVAVYVSDADLQAKDSLKVFLIVLDNNQLVIASARGYPRPLIELASAKLDRVHPKGLHL